MSAPVRAPRRGPTRRVSRPLVIAANRLPVVAARDGFRRADGGLVTALWPAIQQRGATWIGWDGGSAVPSDAAGAALQLAGVPLSRGELDAYYHGFANRTLWPLLHGLVERYALEHRWWVQYRDVNERFAAAIAEAAPADGVVWIHDYHLMLVPQALRARAPGLPLLFFLHVPFPPPETWLRMPWAETITESLLACDAVGFQTASDRDNFVRAAVALHLATPAGADSVRRLDGRLVRVVAHPIGIDTAQVEQDAVSRRVVAAERNLRRSLGDRRIILGVDRLDYTKGIIERLRAFEILLEQRRDLRSRVCLLQLAVPSRGDIREYRELRSEVEEAVGRISGRFTPPGGVSPVHYLHRTFPYERLLALYRMADVAAVTPLRDGMNLVAKEYCAVQGAIDGSGALVLSTFAGAAVELPWAIPCNPFHPEGLAGSLELALELEEDERRTRMRRLADVVRTADVHRWARRELAELDGAARATSSRYAGTHEEARASELGV